MMEALQPRPETQTAHGRAGVAADVRRLISQAESGQGLDLEFIGHAFDVGQDAAAAVTARGGATALAAEIERRVDAFARARGSSQMYLRLVITDIAPDLPEYDPSEVIIFDGINGGTNFSTADVRLTNMGTVMTSVNITDLRAYFETGRKRILVAYLGTDRNADAKALDRMLAALPALLSEAGMKPAEIAEVMAAIRAGDIPPAIAKALHGVVALADLKSRPQTPEIQAQIAAIQKQLPALLAHAQASPLLQKGLQAGLQTAMQAVLVRALTVLVPQAVQPPRISATIRADNDNRVLDAPRITTAAITATAIRALVTELRTLARDKTNLSPAQRREIAAVLRDLRAGLRAAPAMRGHGMTPPRIALPRIVAGLVRLDAMTAPLAALRQPPAFIARILPRMAALTLAVATPAVSTQIRTAIAGTPAIPPRQRAILQRVLETRGTVPASMALRVTQSPSIISAMPPAIVAPVISRAVTTLVMETPQATPAPAVIPAQPSPATIETPVSPSMPAMAEAKPVRPAAPQAEAAKPSPAMPPAPETIVPVMPKTAPAPVAGETPAPAPASPPPPKPDAIAAPVLPTAAPAILPAANEVTPPASPGNQPQYNPDGTLKDCCRDRFLTVAGKTPDTTPDVVFRKDGGIALKDETGRIVAAYTAQDVAVNQDAHAAISAALARNREGEGAARPNTATAAQWNNDLAAMMGGGVRKTFGHVCGDGCTHDHGPKKQSADTLAKAAVEGAKAMSRDVEVKLKAAKPAADTEKTTPAWIARRTMRPV